MLFLTFPPDTDERTEGVQAPALGAEEEEGGTEKKINEIIDVTRQK